LPVLPPRHRQRPGKSRQKERGEAKQDPGFIRGQRQARRASQHAKSKKVRPAVILQ